MLLKLMPPISFCFLNMATRIFGVTYVVCIELLLDRASLDPGSLP